MEFGLSNAISSAAFSGEADVRNHFSTAPRVSAFGGGPSGGAPLYRASWPSNLVTRTKAVETLMKYLAIISLVVLAGCAQQPDVTAVCRDAIAALIKINSLCPPQ